MTLPATHCTTCGAELEERTSRATGSGDLVRSPKIRCPLNHVRHLVGAHCGNCGANREHDWCECGENEE